MPRFQLDTRVDSLVGFIGGYLPELGFSNQPKVIKGSKHRWYRWRRDNGWKSEEIAFYHSYGNIFELRGQIGVILPIDRQPEQEEFVLDAADVAYVCKRGEVAYRIPTWISRTYGWTSTRLRNRLRTDIRRSQKWFDRFATPNDCIATIDSGETNWGMSRGRPLMAALEYLRSL